MSTPSIATQGPPLTAKQQELNALLRGDATHVLAYGGSRSGKTVCFIRALVIRAARAPNSRHLIARYRFNHAVASIWHDSLPKVFERWFPDIKYTTDKAAWFWRLPNGSEIWVAGLDDSDRVEKILGTEFSTIFLNECSQIALSSRNLVITRLAQNSGLKLRCYLDENPPMVQHWTHKMFIEKREAEQPYAPLKDPDDFVALQMNPRDNAENLPATYLNMLQGMGPREKLRFWEGEFGDASEAALWSFSVIDKHRVHQAPDIGSLRRIVVGVDPSGAREGDGDLVGIVVAGLQNDGHVVVLEDASLQALPNVWGQVAVRCAERFGADAIVVEGNYGGSMCEAVIRAAAAEARLRVNVKLVHATKSKAGRAEPFSVLYHQGKVHHVGNLMDLEDEMLSFTTHGFLGDGSPDRVDALVHALGEFYPRMISSGGARYDSVRGPAPDLPKSYKGDEWAHASKWERHKLQTSGGRGSGQSRPARQQERGTWAKGRGWK